MEHTIGYMQDHLNQALRVATLASLVNVSPSHFFALFKRHTGLAPMEYFTRLRMECARQLLESATSSVKEVAAILGYEDPFYFSRVFKSATGICPSAYRSLNSGDRKAIPANARAPGPGAPGNRERPATSLAQSES